VSQFDCGRFGNAFRQAIPVTATTMPILSACCQPPGSIPKRLSRKYAAAVAAANTATTIRSLIATLIMFPRFLPFCRELNDPGFGNVVPRDYQKLDATKIGGRPAVFRRAPFGMYQPAYKPGSGWHAGKRPAHVTAIPLGRRLPGASSNQPGRQDLDTDPEAASSSAPPLFGLAPGGVCRAADVAAGAVRSYRTVSPLLRPLPE